MYEIHISSCEDGKNFCVVLYDENMSGHLINREQLWQVISWLRLHPITHYEQWDSSGDCWSNFTVDTNKADFESLKGIIHAD
jgi:hypothetical protein